MSSPVMMNLGGFEFGLDTAAFEELRRSTSYSWPEQARIGAVPAMQFNGLSSDAISLPGRIFPHFRGGLGQVDGMRSLAGKGKPLLLADGMGSIKGFWVIIRVEEGRKLLWGSGAPRQQDFVLDLKYFGPNGTDTAPRAYPVVAAGAGASGTSARVSRNPVAPPARATVPAKVSTPPPETPDRIPHAAAYTLGALGPFTIGITLPRP